MGHRAERVRHQIQAENCNKRAGLSRLRHGIYLGGTCSECSSNERPPHLEALCRWSLKCTRKRSGSNPDLSRRIDIEYALRFGFQASNNEVGYEAVIADLNLAHSLEVDQLEVCSDSQLVVRQIEDTYEAKSGRMILYLQKVRDLLKKFVQVQVRHVPRAENSRADALAKLATALQEDLSRSTPVEYLVEPSIDLCDVEVAQVESEPSWMDPIWDYIIDGRLPDDPKEASKIRTRSARFTNHKGSLYK